MSPPPTTDNLAVARKAIADGDAPHAATHLAGALHDDPLRDLRDDVDELISIAGDDPVSLAPLGEDCYLGRAVLRVLILERLDRWADAVLLLLSIQVGTPNAALLPWLSRWHRFAAALPALDRERFARLCLHCLEQPGAPAELAPLMQFVAEHSEPDGYLAWAATRALRLAHNLDDALRFIQRQYERAPTYRTAIGLATTLRETGQLEAALSAYREAAAFDLNGTSAWLDIGDILLELRRLDEAAATYAHALTTDPAQHWALASRDFALALAGDGDAERRLETLARTAAADSRARDLHAQLDPFAFALRCPGSATVQVLAEAIARDVAPQRLGLSSLEPPSAMLALRRTARARGWPPVPVEVTVRGTPDPRTPLAAVDHPIWTYAKPGLLGRLAALTTEARPALSPPPPKLADDVATLAARPYAPDAWCAEARALAHRLAPADARSLLAVLAHPPPLADYMPWDAIFRCQVAAALVLAFLDDVDVRTRALRSLVYGPPDWSSSAAIVAVTVAARVEPARTTAALELLLPVLSETITPIRYQNLHAIVVPCLLALPALAQDVRARLIRTRHEYFLSS
jgi:tetratricopeptide (TPR) repeat protein